MVNDKTTQATYQSAKDMAITLKDLGYPGISMLDVFLEPLGDDGDKETFFIQGNGIIVPQPFADVSGRLQNYNITKQFGINFNGDGSDSEDWISFNTTPVGNVIPLRKITDVFFFKFTVRSERDVTEDPIVPIRLYIIQNPFWMNQINLLLKDIVR